MSVTWTGLDVFCGITILLSTLFALNRGLIASVLSLIGWILSIAITHYSFPYMEPFLEAKMGPFLAVAVGYATILLIMLIVFAIMNHMIAGVFGKFRCGTLDRILGMFFGIFRGVIVSVLFFLCFMSLFNFIEGNGETDPSFKNEKKLPNFIKNAASYGFLQKGRSVLLGYLSDDLYKRFDNLDNIESSDISSGKDTNVVIAIRKLTNYVTPDDLKGVESKTRSFGATHSDYDVAMYALKLLLIDYRNNQETGKISRGLSSDELREIELILSKWHPTENTSETKVK